MGLGCVPVSVWSGVAAFGIMAKTNVLPPVYRAVFDRTQQSQHIHTLLLQKYHRTNACVSPHRSVVCQWIIKTSQFFANAHAHSVRLRQQIFNVHPWLQQYYALAPDGSLQRRQPARWLVLRHNARGLPGA